MAKTPTARRGSQDTLLAGRSPEREPAFKKAA